MGIKKTIRLIAKLTLFEHIVEFIYWLLVIYLLITLTQWLAPTPVVMYVAITAYVVAVIALYFFAVKRVKAMFKDD